MQKEEPKRHHYIPQFILRRFNDSNGQICYWDIKTKKLEKRNTKSVFMNFNMYRDEINNTENPTEIESLLSVFENEIADLINTKIIDKNEIILNRLELQKLRIFTSLLSFRSNLRMEQYKNAAFDEDTRRVLSAYQPDGNFEDLWKKELIVLSKTRVFEDIEKAKEIDPIIKQDFLNDLHGYFITFVDARGGEFLITDTYPTLEIFPINYSINIHLHCMFPLSPTRMMILNHIMFKQEISDDSINKPMIMLSKIKDKMIVPPKPKYEKNYNTFSYNDTFVYRVQKIYSKDVEYLNSLFLNEARIGVVFSNSGKIINSIISYDKIDMTKQKFNDLENLLFKKNSDVEALTEF